MKGLLLNAIESGKKLEMIYQSNKGELSQRVIKVEKVGEDYFRAYCFTRNQVRTFSMSNILSIGPHSKYRRGA